MVTKVVNKNKVKNISFLEKHNKAIASAGIERVKEDKSHEALKSLVTVHRISIALIILSSLLFLWTIKLYKSRVSTVW